MDLGDLTDNKLVSLALHGYGPFQPEIGIFCGAYQGIMYPNPTTLSYPGFDPYLYREATPTEFTPNKTFTGLDVGNPGIDYKNPGHILGLLDTFGRMSYGIGVLQAIADGEDGSTLIGPAVDLSLPLVLNADYSDASIGLGNIYPSITEVPSAYINHFSISSAGNVSPNPRGGAVFPSLGVGISPVTNIIDDTVMNSLFFQRSIFSYLGMPQYFRSVIDSMVTSAELLETKSTHTFSLDDDEDFNNYIDTNFFDDLDTDPSFTIASTGSIVSQCKVMGATQALRTLTNSSVYHNGTDGQNEYRSLTELNSVVNLVPLQMISATYQKHYVAGGLDGTPDGAGGLLIASYAIFDFVINVSDIPPDPENPSPGTVTIAGDVTIKGLITNTEALRWRQISQQLPVPASNILIPGWGPNEADGSYLDATYSAAETVTKRVQIQISSRNNTSWDKEWLDGASVSLDSGFSDIDILHRDASTDLTPLDTTPLVIPFNQTVELDRGITSIRLRVIAKVEHILNSDSLIATLWEDPNNSSGPNGTMPEPSETCHEHLILDGTEFVLDFHCHPYLGVLNNFFLNDPLTAADDIQEGSLALSLTANGTRLSTISYEMSN